MISLSPLIIALPTCLCLVGCGTRTLNEQSVADHTDIFPNEVVLGTVSYGESARRIIAPLSQRSDISIESVTTSCTCAAAGVEEGGQSIWVEVGSLKLGGQTSSVLVQCATKDALHQSERIELYWTVEGIIQPVTGVYHLGIYHPGQNGAAEIAWKFGKSAKPRGQFTVHIVFPDLVNETVELTESETCAKFAIDIPDMTSPKLYAGRTIWCINGSSIEHETFLEVVPRMTIEPASVKIIDGVSSHIVTVQCDAEDELDIVCPSGTSWNWKSNDGRVRTGILQIDGSSAADGDSIRVTRDSYTLGTIRLEGK